MPGHKLLRSLRLPNHSPCGSDASASHPSHGRASSRTAGHGGAADARHRHTALAYAPRCAGGRQRGKEGSRLGAGPGCVLRKSAASTRASKLDQRICLSLQGLLPVARALQALQSKLYSLQLSS